MRILAKCHFAFISNYYEECDLEYIAIKNVKFIRLFRDVNSTEHSKNCSETDAFVGIGNCLCDDRCWYIDGANEFGFTEEYQRFYEKEDLINIVNDFCLEHGIPSGLRVLEISSLNTLYPE